MIPVLAGLVALVGCNKQLPHGGEDPLYPLRGLHAAVPCEGCHGPGTPGPLPTLCADCHANDVPSPDHYPGQECGACHTEYGWLDGVTPTIPTDTGPTVPTGDTGTPPTTVTKVDHSKLASDRLCWDCHEDARKDPTHYADPAEPQSQWWDCGPCHTVNAWSESTIDHPARTPHGTVSAGKERPEAAWVVACETCHPVEYTTSDCSTCHLDIFPHYGDAQKPGPLADESCLACHVAGDL